MVGEHAEVDHRLLVRIGRAQRDRSLRIGLVDPEIERADAPADRMPAGARDDREAHVAGRTAGQARGKPHMRLGVVALQICRAAGAREIARDADRGVLDQVASDARQRATTADVPCLRKLVRRADAAAHQHRRAMDRPAGEDQLAAVHDLALAPARDLGADRRACLRTGCAAHRSRCGCRGSAARAPRASGRPSRRRRAGRARRSRPRPASRRRPTCRSGPAPAAGRAAPAPWRPCRRSRPSPATG